MYTVLKANPGRIIRTDVSTVLRNASFVADQAFVWVANQASTQIKRQESAILAKSVAASAVWTVLASVKGVLTDSTLTWSETSAFLAIANAQPALVLKKKIASCV